MVCLSWNRNKVPTLWSACKSRVFVINGLSLHVFFFFLAIYLLKKPGCSCPVEGPAVCLLLIAPPDIVSMRSVNTGCWSPQGFSRDVLGEWLTSGGGAGKRAPGRGRARARASDREAWTSQRTAVRSELCQKGAGGPGRFEIKLERRAGKPCSLWGRAEILSYEQGGCHWRILAGEENDSEI